MIFDSHCAHLYLKKGDVLFLLNMVGMMNAVGAVVEAEHSKRGRNIFEESIRFYDTAVTIVFLEGRCTEMCNAGFPIVHVTADPLESGKEMQAEAGKPDD